MIQIRQGVFETNSSSTHSIVIAKDSDWGDFVNHKKLYNFFSEQNYSKETRPRLYNPLPQFVTVQELLRYIANLEDSITSLLFQLENPSSDLSLSDKKDLQDKRTKILDELAYLPETFISCDDVQEFEICGKAGVDNGNILIRRGEEVFPRGKKRVTKGHTAYGFDHFFG